jgi:hypothetical protein
MRRTRRAQKVDRHSVLLLEWLVQKVHEKKIRGLDWYDEADGIVQIPWKHGAKRNFDENSDGILFRDWAIHTGVHSAYVHRRVLNFKS